MFPTKSGREFSPSFPKTAVHLYTQFLRIFAHLYHAHFRDILHLSLEAHLNVSFKTFISFSIILLPFRSPVGLSRSIPRPNFPKDDIVPADISELLRRWMAGWLATIHLVNEFWSLFHQIYLWGTYTSQITDSWLVLNRPSMFTESLRSFLDVWIDFWTIGS